MSLNQVLSFIIGKPVGKQSIPAHQLSTHKRALRFHALLRREAQVGADVFGEVPAGHAREFFCLDQYTWVWSEQWMDARTNQWQQMTVRYEFQPQGVLKVVNNIPRGYLKGAELKNLLRAMHLYTDRVKAQVYSQSVAAA